MRDRCRPDTGIQKKQPLQAAVFPFYTFKITSRKHYSFTALVITVPFNATRYTNKASMVLRRRWFISKKSLHYCYCLTNTFLQTLSSAVST